MRAKQSKRDRRRPRHSDAVALVMVLCALFLLSLVIFGLAQRVKDDLFMVGRDSRALDARALAFTGLQIALHPLASLKTPALRRNVDSTHRYAARIVGEGGKLNLNWLLAGKTRANSKCSRFTSKAGDSIPRNATFSWTACSTGSSRATPITSTAARQGWTVSPRPGRPFEDLAEVRRVHGSEPLTHQSDWVQDFTLLSRGPIDLQWASEEVIATLPGVGQMRARGFVQQRRGEDQIDGTADDVVFAKINNPLIMAQFLGMSQETYQLISDLVAPPAGDPTVRIISAGQAFDTVRTLEVVARKEGLQPQILSWKED